MVHLALMRVDLHLNMFVYVCVYMHAHTYVYRVVNALATNEASAYVYRSAYIGTHTCSLCVYMYIYTNTYCTCMIMIAEHSRFSLAADFLHRALS